MGEFPGSIDYFVDEQRTFINALVPKANQFAIVIHKTACGAVCSAESQGVFFQTNPEEKSVHYVVGKDGHVVQCVHEKDGAGGNCCLENGYDLFWDKAPTKSNLNMCTFSIEHCDYTNDNSDPLTDAQKQASFKLVAYLAHKYAIGMDHIKGHNSIAPQSRARCPGNYPWQELFQYLKGEGVTVPAGWNDNNGILTCPNGKTAKLGFRQHILDSNWDASDYILQEEQYVNSVEESNTSLGAGSFLVTRNKRLEWTQTRGVFEGWLGQEYLYVKNDRDNCRKIISDLQTQINTLQQGLPTQDLTAVRDSVTKLMSDLQAFLK